jgi:hypothetical protein
VSVKQKESNQNLGHKLKPKNTKPKKKREFHTHQIRNENLLLFSLSRKPLKKHKSYALPVAVVCCKTLTNKRAFLRKRREQSAADRCDCLGEEDEAVVPLNVPCHVL